MPLNGPPRIRMGVPLRRSIHVPVGNDDRQVAAFRGLCEPLEEGDVLFNFLNFLLAGVDEDQIVDSGNQFLCPMSVALGHGHVFHGNEAFNPGIIEESPGLELPAESVLQI